MHTRTWLLVIPALVVSLAFAACGGGGDPVALSAIPAPEGGTELDANIASTLANNNATDAIVRAQLGSGGKTEQKGYSMPADADWNSIKAYYDTKLKADGWGTNGTLTNALEAANATNPLFKMANWQKGDQNVSVLLLSDPTDEAKKNLIVSLTTN